MQPTQAAVDERGLQQHQTDVAGQPESQGRKDLVGVWKRPRFWLFFCMILTAVLVIVLAVALWFTIGPGAPARLSASSSNSSASDTIDVLMTASNLAVVDSLLSSKSLSGLSHPDAADILRSAFGNVAIPFVATAAATSVSKATGISVDATTITDVVGILAGDASIREKTLQFINIPGVQALLPNSTAVKGTLKISPTVSVDATLVLYAPSVSAAASPNFKPEFAIITELTADQARQLTSNGAFAPKAIQAAAGSFLKNLIPNSSMQVVVASSTFNAQGFSFVRGVSVRMGVTSSSPSLLADSVASLLTTTAPASATPLSVVAYYPYGAIPASGYMQVGIRNAVFPISSSSSILVSVGAVMFGVNGIGSSTPTAAFAISGSVGKAGAAGAYLKFGARANIASTSLSLKFEAADISIPRVEKFLKIQSVTGSAAATLSGTAGAKVATINGVSVSGTAVSPLFQGTTLTFSLAMPTTSEWSFTGSATFARITADQIVALAAGKPNVVSAGDASQIALTNVNIKMMVSSVPMVFDTASTVLDGTAVVIRSTIALPASVVTAFSKVGITTSANLPFAVMVHVPVDIINNDAKLIIAPEIPARTAGKIELTSTGAYISARATRFNVGVRMILKATLGNSPLTFYTYGTVGTTVGATLAGAMVGTWNNAFGLSGLAVSNVSTTVSFVPPSTITVFGISASFRLGEASAFVAGHIDPLGSNYGVQGSVSNLSLDGLVRFALSGSPAASAILASKQANAKFFQITSASYAAADSSFAVGNVVYNQGASLSAAGTILGASFSAYMTPKTTRVGAVNVRDFDAGVTITDVSLKGILQAIKDSNVWGMALRNATIAYVAQVVPAFQNAAANVKAELQQIAKSVGQTLTNLGKTIANCLFRFKCNGRRGIVDNVINAIDSMFVLNKAEFDKFSLVEFMTLQERDLKVAFDAEILGVLKINTNFTMDFAALASNQEGFARALFENMLEAGDRAIAANKDRIVEFVGGKVKNAVCQQFLKRDC